MPTLLLAGYTAFCLERWGDLIYLSHLFFWAIIICALIFGHYRHPKINNIVRKKNPEAIVSLIPAQIAFRHEDLYLLSDFRLNAR